jgi:hypothetical protein
MATAQAHGAAIVTRHATELHRPDELVCLAGELRELVLPAVPTAL